MPITLIQDKAEEGLMETAGVCARVRVPLRCLFFAFSTIVDKPKDWLSDVLKALSGLFDNENAMIYVTHDDDLFLMSRGATHKTLLRALGAMPRKIVPVPDEQLGLAHLFELSIDGLRIEQMAVEKIRTRDRLETAAIMAQSQCRAAEKENYQRDIEMDIALNANLIVSLGSRRIERKRPVVLMIEDDIFSQRLFSNLLRQDFDVHCASDGRQGLLAYIKMAPDILFLDIDLPDINGISVLHEIFNIDPKAFVVMLSGNGNRDNVMKAIQAGAKGFVGKPFTLDKLMKYIEKCPFIVAKKQKREMINV